MATLVAPTVSATETEPESGKSPISVETNLPVNSVHAPSLLNLLTPPNEVDEDFFSETPLPDSHRNHTAQAGETSLRNVAGSDVVQEGVESAGLAAAEGELPANEEYAVGSEHASRDSANVPEGKVVEEASDSGAVESLPSDGAVEQPQSLPAESGIHGECAFTECRIGRDTSRTKLSSCQRSNPDSGG